MNQTSHINLKLIIAGLQVKHSAFSDKEDKYFETESAKHKVLLTKTPTLANPYIFLPDALKKIMEEYHPRKTATFCYLRKAIA